MGRRCWTGWVLADPVVLLEVIQWLQGSTVVDSRVVDCLVEIPNVDVVRWQWRRLTDLLTVKVSCVVVRGGFRKRVHAMRALGWLGVGHIKAKDFAWIDNCRKSFEELKAYLGSPPLLSKPIPREDLFLYLSVTEVTVSPVLVIEEDGVQKLTYYVSKFLQDVETRYPKIDKIAVALITSTRHL
ncbi:hypothetical protein RJ639_047109 [Escallonia herrerae]|uniref:Reverse transcriptase/retrotransposon-derived protein RNase H-like domain-containing protein n=1 Tax=Escallonia herrerae TaxID=1293975 RepID=A0AA88W8P5_9ASTE|nr:hypothetical protein RJ639_047109 [Escallonia herrerae]